jgi:nucleoside-diphosphate-sugar epimerase
VTALVTGGAGFIGSHLAEALLADGQSVRIVDCLTSYYGIDVKWRNLRGLMEHDGCEFVDADLRTADLDLLLEDVDVVYHQAGQPGVRLSWSDGFAEYDSINILATQRLLEAARERPLSRFVYASSSSVYGNAARYPTSEDDLPQPMSPYGVTKLAAEHLCGLYARNWGVPTTSLRYFTVYGPRQRPDMATHRLIAAALDQHPFPLYGDGAQVRDFTYVGDVVHANLAAGAGVDVEPGAVVNVAGGGSITLAGLIDLVGEIVGSPVPIDRRPSQPGDVDRTGGSIDRAWDLIGWRPATSLGDGITAQVDWHRTSDLA